jgi:hypothetical protein
MRKKKRLVLDDSTDRLVSREAFRKSQVMILIENKNRECRNNRWREEKFYILFFSCKSTNTKTIKVVRIFFD